MKTKSVFSYVKSFEFCDKDHFLIIKGIAILAALVAWLLMRYLSIPGLGPIYYSAMALFIMCSGFGVTESYMKKRGLFHFWENKAIKIWAPSLVVLIVVAVIKGGIPIAWVPEYPLALKGDMLYLLFAEYIVFWFVFRFIPLRPVRILVMFACSAIAYIFVPEELTNVKSQFFCFPVGVMFAQLGWKRKIRLFGWKGKLLLTLGCLAAGAGTWALANYVTIPYLDTLTGGLFFMAAAVCLCVVVWAAQKLPVFGIFVPFGMISYMLYLLYNDVFLLYKPGADWRVFILVVVILFVAAGVLTWLRELLVIWNKNLRRRGKTQLKGSM